MSDFDLSLIIPFYGSFCQFECFFSSNIKYFERNGIEVVIIIDKSMKLQEVQYFISIYPFVNWKLVIYLEEHIGQDLAHVVNVGIRHAIKQYILILDWRMDFLTDIIYHFRSMLDFYTDYYTIGQVRDINFHKSFNVSNTQNGSIYYGGLMVKKESLERIGGYNEQYPYWNKEINLRKRLELAGLSQLFIPDAIQIYHEDYYRETSLFTELQKPIPDEIISNFLLPKLINENGYNWGKDNNIVVYDWKAHPYAKKQCRSYLSSLKEFEILTDDIFDKSFPLVALIPTHNESHRITNCLRSIEKHCDGIIVLDDDSSDSTYEIIQSSKLLLKVKKNRTGFLDKQNRNILLDIASFIKAEWFIFIDADELFDDRFVNLRNIMNGSADSVGVWIANLWDSPTTYRVDMKDTNPLSKNGLWLRWRMFRNKGRTQIVSTGNLHVTTVPSLKNSVISKTLLLHLAYLEQSDRQKKYTFYKNEDSLNLFPYEDILVYECHIDNLSNIDLYSLY